MSTFPLANVCPDLQACSLGDIIFLSLCIALPPALAFWAWLNRPCGHRQEFVNTDDAEPDELLALVPSLAREMPVFCTLVLVAAMMELILWSSMLPRKTAPKRDRQKPAVMEMVRSVTQEQQSQPQVNKDQGEALFKVMEAELQRIKEERTSEVKTVRKPEGR